MSKSACTLMKLVAVLSIALIGGGSLLVLVAQQLSLQSMLPAVVTALGFFSIFSGVLALIVTALVITLPNVSRQLDLCRH